MKLDDIDLTKLPDDELVRLKYWSALRGKERVRLIERIEAEEERRENRGRQTTP